MGKLYPVTAAQLLPILTGFLAPAHFFQASKELEPRTNGLRFERQDLFSAELQIADPVRQWSRLPRVFLLAWRGLE